MTTYALDGWAAFGDPTRRTIFARLAEAPSAVGELAATLPVTRPAVSQHLKILKDAGLVLDARGGSRRIYRVNQDGLSKMRAELDSFWNDTLTAYKHLVEQPDPISSHAGPDTGGSSHQPPGKYALTETTDPTDGHATIEVDAPVQRAFEVFSRDFGAFKPPEHNLLAVPIAETVVETHVGGHIIDRGADGSECPWATVLAYEPPDRFVFSWNISPHWQVETDPDKRSEVEVTFTALGQDRTRVDINHRHLDRHGEGWAGVRKGVSTDEGWPLYLSRYADLLAA